MFSKKFSIFLIVLFLVIPFALAAEDDLFDDSADTEEKSKDDSGKVKKEAKEEDETVDAAKDAEDKEDKEAKESEDAMNDLLGEESKTEKKESKEESAEDILGVKSEKKEAVAVKASGIKPVLIVKGGLYAMAGYKDIQKSKWTDQKLMFGGLDEGIFGAELKGNAVFAKATMNLRTFNKLVDPNIQYNPLIADNYYGSSKNVDSNMNGTADTLVVMPYEVYAGMKLFNMITLRGGNMIPAYGLVDQYQHVDIVMGTAFGTRSLITTEGYLPETDRGIAFGLDYSLGNDSSVKGELMITGNSGSKFEYSDQTMGIYFKAGYEMEMLKLYASFQYRKDYTVVYDAKGNPFKKNPVVMGGGLAAKLSVSGFETLFSFDSVSRNLVQGVNLKAANGMLISLMPAYNIEINKDAMDKFQVAVRFDYVKGVYKPGTADALAFDSFSADKSLMRVGFAGTLFAKEVEGVKSYFGLSYIMQPKAEVGPGKIGNPPTTVKDSMGFNAFMVTAGAEF